MDKKRNILIIALSMLIVVCVGVTAWALFFRGDPDPISPDYPPQGTDDNQRPIEGDDSTKIDSPEGGGAINVTFGTSATASLGEKTVQLYYANPGASNQNVAILIVIGEMVVAKSDLITPGNEVTQLTLEDYAASMLQLGGYDAQLVVRAYDPDSGEKAMVDTKGQITLTVIE